MSELIPPPSTKTTRRQVWQVYGWPLLLFLGLSLAVSWPTVRDFTTKIVSDGGDARNNLWMLWHVKEFVLGNEPLFQTSMLYYPFGATLLTRGFGPLLGFLVLPLWPLGPEAVLNGAVLISLCLTGYFMYLLACGLGFSQRVALFAGMMLMMAPMPLVGVYGHLTKAFLGMIPLVLLTVIYALDGRRRGWWSVVVAVALLLTLLHNGQQFIFAGLLAGVWMGIVLVTSTNRRLVITRMLLIALSCTVIVGPLLWAIVMASNDPAIVVGTYLESLNYRPDLAEFVLPARHHLLLGWLREMVLQPFGVDGSIETAVSLSWLGLLLCLLAGINRRQQVQHWLWLTAGFALLALGPSLQILGKTQFTKYQYPVILPYAVLTELPFLDVLRTPGRFMMVGYVTFVIASSFGLAWLMRRFPHRATLILGVAVLWLMLENWPQPWPQEQLRQTPAFYQQLAEDDAVYGVFDLPIKPRPESWHIGYASHYQIYQMTHGKGIASGYIARTYFTHPLLPCLIPEYAPPPTDILVNGRPIDCYDDIAYRLAANGYRYIVWHKSPPGQDPSDWAGQTSQVFLEAAVGDQRPFIDDETLRVYELTLPIPDEPAPTPIVGVGTRWYAPQGEERWAESPATLYIASVTTEDAWLEITPGRFYDPTTKTINPNIPALPGTSTSVPRPHRQPQRLRPRLACSV